MGLFDSISEKAKALASSSSDSLTEFIGSVKNSESIKNEVLVEESLSEPSDSEVQNAINLAEEYDKLQEQVFQYLAENSEKLKQWYSENQINEKIANVAKKAGGIIIYPVLLLCNVLKSPQTSLQDKMFIIAPLAYFVMPADIIPDLFAGVGYMDDGLAIIKSLQSLSTSITFEMQEDAKMQCKNIFGELDEDMLTQITDVVSNNQDLILSSFVNTNNKNLKKKNTKK